MSAKHAMDTRANTPSEQDTCTVKEFEDAVRAFLQGDLTLAQLEGLTADEMYAMADVGRDLLSAGNVEAARSIFEGLAGYNPHDPYFQLVLGSIEQQAGNYSAASQRYRNAVDLYPDEISGWTNLGECQLMRSCELHEGGDVDDAGAALDDALEALTHATRLDPQAETGPGRRAHALLAVTAASAVEATDAA